MLKLGVYLILIALIVSSVQFVLFPTVMCWRESGTWHIERQTCVIGTHEKSGDELMNPLARDVVDGVNTRINPAELKELIINIPNSEMTTATLARTNDALVRFMASFPQAGTDIEGYAEARADEAVVDAESGLALVPFFVNYGGTGSFVYVGLFDASTSSPKHLDSVLVGDRLSIDDVSFERSGDALKAVVLYKDRKEGQPMAMAPSVPKKVVIDITDRKFGSSEVYDRSLTYTATYKDMVKLETLAPKDTVRSPLTIRGVARGPWFFEASFPVFVTDWDGVIIGQGTATAIGDWMTEDFVPFTVSMLFTVPPDTPYKRGTVILQKDNPSGLPEHDDAFEIPVLFD